MTSSPMHALQVRKETDLYRDSAEKARKAQHYASKQAEGNTQVSIVHLFHRSIVHPSTTCSVTLSPDP